MHHAMRSMLAVVTLVAGCGGVDEPPPDRTPIVQVGEIGVRLSPEGMQEFVLSGLYKAWPHKTERRDARQNHKLATTYYNRLLSASYSNGKTVFPEGSLAINEEDLDDDGVTDGYSLSVKIQETPEQASWFWYQAPVDDLSAPFAFAPGHPDCDRCHSTGLDRVLAHEIPTL
jgi:hypothetical protein